MTLSRNWEDPVISQSKKEGPNELMHEPFRAFHLINLKFKIKL